MQNAQRTTEQLKFWLLGSFQVWRGDARIDASLTGQPRKLLALFLLERNQFMSSDRLIEYFWSHLSPHAALNNLQVDIRHLRLWLEPHLKRARDSQFVITEPDGYRFAPAESYLDVDEFTQLVQRGQTALRAKNLHVAQFAFERARQIYRGELLNEVPYDEWALLSREHLSEVHLQMLDDLAETYARLNLYDRVIEICQQGLNVDSLRESFYRHQMRAHAARGELAEAFAVYAQCETRLRQELDVEPSAETRDLGDAIRAGKISIHTDPVFALPQAAFTLPFVGRSEQLATLRRARESKSKAVLIAGEAGAGKTRLIEEFVASLDARAYSSHARASDLPFAAALGLVESYLQHKPSADQLSQLGPCGAALSKYLPMLRDLWRDCPPFSPLSETAERERLHQAILAALRLAAKEKALFVIDDLQWAGEDSLNILTDLLQDFSADSLLLLSCRSDALAANEPIAKWIAIIRSNSRIAEIEMPRLAGEHILEALRDATGLLNVTEFVAQLHQVTGGHPLFLTEILRGLVDAGDLYRDLDGVWRVRRDLALTQAERVPISRTLRDAVLSRTTGMSTLERETLDAAAVLQHRVNSKTLEKMLRLDAAQIENALRDLTRRGLLVENREATAWGFSHALVREALYESNPHSRLMHLLAAHALIAEHPPAPSPMAQEIVEHLRRGGGEDGMIAQWADYAGWWAYDNFAHLQAREFFEQARDSLAREPEAPRDQLLALKILDGLAGAQAITGQVREAIATLESELTLELSPTERASIQVRLAHRFTHDTGEYERAWTILDEAERALSHANPPAQSLLGQAHELRAAIHSWRGEFVAGEKMGRLAVSELQDAPFSKRPYLVLANILQKLGHTVEALDLKRDYYRAAESTGDLRGLAVAGGNLGSVHYALGELPVALEYLNAALARFEQLHDVRQASITACNLGLVYWEMGELAPAETTLRHALAMAEQVGARYTVAFAHNQLGFTLAQRGRWDESRAEFDTALSLGQAIDTKTLQAQTRVHIAQWHWLQGDADAARAEAQRASEIGESLSDGYTRRSCRLLLGLYHLAQGEFDAAETSARQAHELSAQSQQALDLARAERLLGQIAVARKNFRIADAHYAKSERIFRHSSAQLELAQTFLVQAQVLPATHRSDAARLLREAVRLTRRAGARPLLKHAVRALKELGS